jgi:quercetin dioxygenase-like cupin family protein
MNTDPTPAEVLDADIIGLLGAALAPEPPDARTGERIKRRLLRRIADDQVESHLTVGADAGEWQPFGAGLQLKVLHVSQGIMSYLVRLEPGAELPPHRHPVDEECVVLSGALRIGGLRVAAGGFHLGRKDVLHAPIRSEEGALIFLRGAVPELSLAI